MGWLIKDNCSLFGNNLYCRLCLVREQQRETVATDSKICGTQAFQADLASHVALLP